MIGLRIVLLALLAVLLGDSAWARREALTDQQKQQLPQINRILVDVIALTDRGPADATPFRDVIAARLGELGFDLVRDASQPHDVVLKVKCEQRKVWEGTMASGGDADLPDSPLRTWKGPACQLTYLLAGKSTQWKKEVRTDFTDAMAAAAAVKAADPGAYALTQLKHRLEEYDFPLLLAADWGQEDRLLKFLGTSPPVPRKVRAIQALGEMFSAKSVSLLQASLKDQNPEVVKAAAIALGNIGQRESIEMLVALLKQGTAGHKQAAARALGKVGALHGDSSIIPPLLDALGTNDVALQTEVVWALGQLPDRRAYEPLAALQRSLRNVRTSDRTSPEGKLWEAVTYSLKELDGFDQFN